MKKIALMLLLLLLLLLLPALLLAEVKEVNIGVMYSMTGPGASLGKIQMEGAKLAIKQINDQGGVRIGSKRVKITPFYMDDETKPPVAVKNYQKLVDEDHVCALVGGTFAHVSGALNEEAKKKPLLYMATNGIGEPLFAATAKAPYTLCDVASVKSVGLSGGGYVAKKMHAKKVVLLLPDYAYGYGTAEGIKEVFKKYPDIKYLEIFTPVGVKDYAPYFQKAKEFGPDVIMMGQWGDDAIKVLTQAYESGLAKTSKLWFNWLLNDFAINIDPDALAGVTSQMFWYYNMEGFQNESVVKATDVFNAMWSKYNSAPADPYAMTAYVGVHEVVRGIELAQSVESPDIYNAIIGSPQFLTPKGRATWRRDGRPDYKYYTVIVQGKPASARKNKVYDFAKVVDSYEDSEFLPSVESMGYK